MAKPDSLFLLIKSLNRSEKRYFRLFAGMQGKAKNYLKLFAFIEKQDQYEEDTVKKQFVGERFIRQLHVVKHYLRGLILKSLRNFHAEASPDIQIKHLLIDAHIMLQRECYPICQERIKKAEKLAIQYEKHLALLEIIALKRQIALRGTSTLQARKVLNELHQQETEALTQVQHLHQLWDVTANLFDWIPQVGGEQVSGRQSLIAHPLMQVADHDLSLKAHILRQHIRYVHAIMAEGDGKKGMVHLDKVIESLEAHPDRIAEDPQAYIIVLNNKIGAHLHMNGHDEIPKILAKIKRIPETYKLKMSPLIHKALLKTYNVELELYRDQRAYQKGIDLIPEIQTLWQGNAVDASLEYHMLFRFQFAYCHFMLGQYKEALHWVNELINQSYGELRRDIQVFARLLHLFIHYELGNLLYLRYALDATRRFKRKIGPLDSFEQCLLRFFSKICTTPISHHEQLFNKLVVSLEREKNSAVWKNGLDYLDVGEWLSQKK